MTIVKQQTIVVYGDNVTAQDYGYDVNGNRKWVVWFGSIYNFIADRIGNPEYSLLECVDAKYRHVLNAMRSIGGKKINYRSFGGDIVFAGAELSTLGKEIETAIDAYARWYNSEHVAPKVVKQIAKRVRHQLPIVVKSTNRGLTVSGEWSRCNELKIKVEYDHSLPSTDNYVRAALLWIAKAELKRWQLDGIDESLRLGDVYTALDANTRVFTYTITAV